METFEFFTGYSPFGLRCSSVGGL